MLSLLLKIKAVYFVDLYYCKWSAVFLLNEEK
ncbi:MAG: hypothetical protein JWR61_3687 [Ferruginibacter sp.]|nr:hypothetical protein [Ferruginibacter sp.]